jgi:Tol biopolymer transport system component
MLSVALLVVLGAAAAFGAAWWTTRSQPAAELRTLSFHLTSPPQAEFQFAAAAGGSVIAPDGRSAAFVAVRNGTPRLWIRSLESSDGRELEDTDGARQPFWSPDSRSIGFFAGGDLRRVDVSGGTVSTLAPAPEPRGGAWTTDDTIVFSATSAGALQRVSASTGGTRFQLTWFSPEGVVLNTVGTVDRYASLRLSPDGKEALIVIDDASRKRDLWRFDLTGGTRSRVTSGGRGSFVVWSPDGQQIVYSSLLGKELEATSARGAVQVENLWNADTVVYPADVSRDGGRLAYVATHPETGFDIWQLEMKGHASAFRSCGRRSRNTIRSSHLTSSGWCTRRPKVDWKRSTCRPFLTRVAGSSSRLAAAATRNGAGTAARFSIGPPMAV